MMAYVVVVLLSVGLIVLGDPDVHLLGQRALAACLLWSAILAVAQAHRNRMARILVSLAVQAEEIGSMEAGPPTNRDFLYQWEHTLEALECALGTKARDRFAAPIQPKPFDNDGQRWHYFGTGDSGRAERMITHCSTELRRLARVLRGERG